MKRYAFTRVHAHGLVWSGWIMLTLCVAAAAVVALTGTARSGAPLLVGYGIPDGTARVLVGFAILTAGVVIGLILATPLIVAGEIILIFLDQRTLAARHLRVARALRQALAGRQPPEPLSPLDPDRGRRGARTR